MIFLKIQSPQIPSSLQPQDPSQAPLPSPSLSETRNFEKPYVRFQKPIKVKNELKKTSIYEDLPSSLSSSPDAAVLVLPLLLAVSGCVRPDLFPDQDKKFSYPKSTMH